jgi:hypothetical protein
VKSFIFLIYFQKMSLFKSFLSIRLVVDPKDFACGQNKDFSFMLAGGSLVSGDDTWPWMSSFGVHLEEIKPPLKGWQHFCGATLITDSFLLSAGHCLKSLPSTVPLEK